MIARKDSSLHRRSLPVHQMPGRTDSIQRNSRRFWRFQKLFRVGNSDRENFDNKSSLASSSTTLVTSWVRKTFCGCGRLEGICTLTTGLFDRFPRVISREQDILREQFISE